MDEFEEIASVLGDLNLSWTTSQGDVFGIFLHLLNRDEAAANAIFFTIASDRTQREITSAVAKALLAEYPDVRDDIVSTLSDMGRLSGKRNNCIHAIWSRIATETDIKLIAQGAPKLGNNPLSELRAIAKEFESFMSRMGLLHCRVVNEIELPLPNKSP